MLSLFILFHLKEDMVHIYSIYLRGQRKMASYLSTSSSSACKSYSVDYKRHSTVDINKCLKNGPISNWTYHWVDLLARNESKCEFQFIFRIAKSSGILHKYTSSHKNLLFLYSMLLYFSSRVQLQVKSPKEIKILLILCVYVIIFAR